MIGIRKSETIAPKMRMPKIMQISEDTGGRPIHIHSFN